MTDRDQNKIWLDQIRKMMFDIVPTMYEREHDDQSDTIDIPYEEVKPTAIPEHAQSLQSNENTKAQ